MVRLAFYLPAAAWCFVEKALDVHTADNFLCARPIGLARGALTT